MTKRRVQCRAYIVYRNGLFAEGMRSILSEAGNAVEVIGMESDPRKALKAVASLKPEVVVLEEPTLGKKKKEMGRLETFLQRATTGRVVCLSLDHDHATVYQREQVAGVSPGDLIKAIGGGSRKGPCRPGPHALQTTAATVIQPASGRDGGGGRPGRRSHVKRSRSQTGAKR